MWAPALNLIYVISKAILCKCGAEGYYNVGGIRVACGAGAPASEDYSCKGQHKAVDTGVAHSVRSCVITHSLIFGVTDSET